MRATIRSTLMSTDCEYHQLHTCAMGFSGCPVGRMGYLEARAQGNVWFSASTGRGVLQVPQT